MNLSGEDSYFQDPTCFVKRLTLKILCPYFCRNVSQDDQPEKNYQENKNDLELTAEESARISSYLKINGEEGFLGALPYKLYNSWEEFMMPDLFDLWACYIYGSKEGIVPDYRRFCTVIKGQWSPSLEKKVRSIISIAKCLDYDEVEKYKPLVDRRVLIKYFFDLLATYLRCMGYWCNPEFLMWINCDATFVENNLRIAMNFFFEKLPSEEVCEDNLLALMAAYKILPDILTSVIEITFGIREVSNWLVPRPISDTETVLDVAQVVILTSLARGDTGGLYEWEMLYSFQEQGCDWTRFVSSVTEQGPTIVVVKDEAGWVFGGYAGASWRVSDEPYGEDASFLFRVYPSFGVFPSAPSCEHMHLSGRAIAMGGTGATSGLWLSIERPTGSSHTDCQAFREYHCLANSTTFRYRNLEVWRVSPIV